MTREGAGWRLYRDTARSQAHDMTGCAGGMGARGAQGVGARERGSRLGACAGRSGRGLGLLLGQQAVHSVHSACFDPVSTQYCS